MAVSNNANIGFEKQIWDAACVLWGHIPAAEYRKVIDIRNLSERIMVLKMIVTLI